MRTLKIYTDGSYTDEEMFSKDFIPAGREEYYMKEKVGKRSSIVHGGFVVLDGNDVPLVFMRVNCSIMSFVQAWSCGGEVVAAMMGVKWADQYIRYLNNNSGYKESKIVVYHDYMGVSEWIKPHGKKKWKAKSMCAVEYVKMMEMLLNCSSYGLEFVKVNAHTGDKWNEVADCLAGNKPNQFISKQVEVINI